MEYLPDLISLDNILCDETLKLPSPELVLFYQELADRHIWLDCEIAIDTCAFFIQYINRLNRKASQYSFTEDPITIHINSPGGDLSTMFSFYHTLKNSQIPIHTINEGKCNSAALIIYLAGTKRTALTDSVFVAHEGSATLQGSYREVVASQKRYEKDVDRMAEIIASETKLTTDEIKAKYSATSDWYIDTVEAKALGIITE